MKVGSGELLVIGVTENQQRALSSLRDDGYRVQVSLSEPGSVQLAQTNLDAIVLSLSKQAPLSQDSVRCIRKTAPSLPIIMICGENIPEQEVIDLMLAGVDDLVVDANAHPKLLRHIINRAVQRKPSAMEVTPQPVDEHRLLKQDQSSGLLVQSRALPESPLLLGGLSLQHRIVPSIILSGDSVNYFQLADGRVLFYLADVSGHGVASALVGVALYALSTRMQKEYEALGLVTSADVLSWFNEQLLQLNFEQHVTMFLGIMDEQKNILQFSNAAHFPGAIMKNDAVTAFLEMGGLPLGICATEYSSQEVVLTHCFDLVLFSDGVLEIMSESTIKDKEQRLLSLVQLESSDIDRLSSGLQLTDQREVPDDIAIFTIARKS